MLLMKAYCFVLPDSATEWAVVAAVAILIARDLAVFAE
jgi:hypothetical protein